MNEDQLTSFLEELTPADFSRILARIPKATNYVPEHVNHLQRVSALLLYVRSSTGPGQQYLEITVQELFPAQFTGAGGEKITSKKLWNVPPPIPHFIGREDILTKIKSDLIREPVIISGLPGMGKTQTAIQFAYQHRNDYHAVFWVMSSNMTVLREGFLEILRLLGMPLGDDRDVIPAVLSQLKIEDDWLLVLDNADDLELVVPVLQELKGIPNQGHILLTTRAKATGYIGKRVYLGEMSDEEGAQLLLRRSFMTFQENQETARVVSQKLGGLPLALDQAGALIEEMALSLDEYLSLFESLGIQIHTKPDKLGFSSHPSLDVTFRLAFEQVEVKDKLAADILRCCAFLSPESAPEEICRAALNSIEATDSVSNNEFQWFSAVRNANSHSLISRDPHTRTFKLHRLVQAVLRAGMGEEEWTKYAESTVSALRKTLKGEDASNSDTYRRLLPSILYWLEVVKDEYSTLNTCANHLCAVANHLFQYMVDVGLWSEWESLYQGVVRVLPDICLDEIREIQFNLGVLRLQERKWDEARTIIEASRQNAQDEKNSYLEALAWLRLGDIAFFNEKVNETSEQQRTRLAKAKDYYQQCFELAISPVGENPHLAAKARLCLGNVFLRQEEWVLAEREYESCISSFDHFHDFANKAVALRNRSISYREQKMIAKAIEGFNESLEIVTTSGNRLDEAIILLKCLVPAYESVEMFDEAINAARVAIEILRGFNLYRDLCQDAKSKIDALQIKLAVNR